MWQAVRFLRAFLRKSSGENDVRGREGGRRRGEREGGCHMPVNTPIKANSPETVRGTREHHYDNPRTPKIRTSKVERHPIERVGDHLLQSFTSH